jgi:hypothetical protein
VSTPHYSCRISRADAAHGFYDRTTGEVLELPQEMELIKVGDTWKISSLIPDQVIIEMQQGFKVSSSSSEDQPHQQRHRQQP